jgi:hypothetical protein
MNPTFKSGSIAGTGAALTINLGWTPAYVKVFNPNDAGSLWPTLEWVGGMPDASGFKTLKTLDNGATGNASSNKITANGITPYAGDIATTKGFTIGADADINVSGETLFWIAMRPGQGA